jgi:hypothetical protein
MSCLREYVSLIVRSPSERMPDGQYISALPAAPGANLLLRATREISRIFG